MKSIIEGKRYDTDQAVRVAEYSNGLPCSDFKHVSEELYITPAGSWFVAGGGGPLSQYAVPCGDGTGGSERITPLERDDAREWLERHDETEALEQHFAEEITDA